jgi:hypothetical protein
VEDELAARTRRLQEKEVALREREAKVEEFLAELRHPNPKIGANNVRVLE